MKQILKRGSKGRMHQGRLYDASLVAAIRSKEIIVDRGGISVLYKGIPENVAERAMDPRYLNFSKRLLYGAQILPYMHVDKMSNAQLSVHFRKFFQPPKNRSINYTPCKEEAVQIPMHGHMIPLRIYDCMRKNDTSKPMILYFHGGAFFAGTAAGVANTCRFLAESTDMIVISVDYRLAPQYYYPAGLNDCFAALLWAKEHAEQLGGDSDRIAVCGDSAGGNLAAVCALRDRDLELGMIKAQVLLYPCINIGRLENPVYDIYDMPFQLLPSEEKIAHAIIHIFQNNITLLERLYVNKAFDMSNPYISPIFAQAHDLPPALICYGEHDYLKMECLGYAKLLKEARVPIECVEYAGMGHAFLDEIGLFPQAEECLRTAASFLKKQLDVPKPFKEIRV